MKHVKLSLRKMDYGLPLGKTITKQASSPYSMRTRGIVRHEYYDYSATFERVDTDRLRIRRGDIIRFASQYKFKKAVRGELGVIIERYRIIKYKLNGTFKDYYAVVLVTTGKLKGQLQHVGCHVLSNLSKQI